MKWMLPLPIYRILLAVLILVTAAGALWLAFDPSIDDGVEITLASTPTPIIPGSGDTSPVALVNLNTAIVSELEDLSCIGPERAKNIVAYRTENGPFQRTDLVMAVPDIGIGTYECIREFVTVGN
jgi:competence ComEA-like helix-hairpin-helix protein